MIDGFPTRKTAALFAALAATTVFQSSVAYADERPVIVLAEPVARTEMVSFASLDLNQAKARKALHFRVAGAVERVCDKDFGRDGLQANEYYRCETGAWTRAQPQIDRAVAQAADIAQNGGDATLAMTAIAVSAG